MAKCEAEGCKAEAQNLLTIQRHSLHSERIEYLELKLCNEHIEAELKSLLKDGDFAVIIVEKRFYP